MAARAAREGAESAVDKDEIRAGVNTAGKRLWRAEITWMELSSESCTYASASHLDSAPNIFLCLASCNSF